jgi:hypothetical protein
VGLALAVLAVVLLVAIGALEAGESARELGELPGRGRPELRPAGGAITVIGLALSTAIYVVLGRLLGRGGEDGRSAVLTGASVGVAAGLVGGTIRALAVRDFLDAEVARFGLGGELVTWSLAAFVGLSAAASAAGGAVLCWLGYRLSRPRPRPPP